MFTTQPKLIIKNSLFWSLESVHNTEVRGFRVLFGKPVNGQKTTTNAQTCKSTRGVLYDFKFKYLNQALGGFLTKPIFLAEYINLFWQQQWLVEWLSSYKNLQWLPIYITKTNFIDIANINRFYIYHQYNNPFKKRVKSTQRRKKVIPKNKYSTGFKFGFSKKYLHQLTNIT